MNQDRKRSNFFWHQRLFGILEPARAMWAAQAVLDGVDRLPGEVVSQRLELASSMLRQALVLMPYDRALDRLVRQLGGMRPPEPLYSRWLGQIQRVLGDDGPSMEQSSSAVEAARGDVDALSGLAGCPHPPSIRFQALMALWALGDADAFLEYAAQFGAEPGGAPGAPVLAWGAWRAGEEDLALALRRAGCDSFLSFNLDADMALARGDADAARAMWRMSLDFEPGQPALVYRLRELDRETPPSALIDRHRVHIAFYTYNKLETTLGTLESLLASEIGQSPITLLNNGSTSFSSEDLAQGVQQRACGRAVEVVNLPVNIGAPAARNWLWQLPASRGADFVAYLDDDVVLPPDWLKWYLSDMEDSPDTAVVGPKGVNPSRLRTIQYVYRYFQTVGEHRIRFMPHAPLVMDLGLYDARRPCLSVMGCCHLLNRKRLEELSVPGFDVRFSPSQVDDLEHDIQVWRRGGKVLYEGRVTVVHLQDAGRAAPKTEAAWAHVWGNHMKMEFKFSGSLLKQVDEAVRSNDEEDWRQALAWTASTLPDRSRKFFQALLTESL